MNKCPFEEKLGIFQEAIDDLTKRKFKLMEENEQLFKENSELKVELKAKHEVIKVLCDKAINLRTELLMYQNTEVDELRKELKSQETVCKEQQKRIRELAALSEWQGVEINLIYTSYRRLLEKHKAVKDELARYQTLEELNDELESLANGNY